MTTLVLTVIGDDRAGLVKALADVVSTHDGNWERSHLAELAGKFAGIVVVTVPDAGAADLRADLQPLQGLLDITVHEGGGGAVDSGSPTDWSGARQALVTVLGNDHPGIVQAVSGAIAAQGLSVVDLKTVTRDAPMAGGRLFEAQVVVSVPPGADLDAVGRDLEDLAGEVQVEIVLEPGDS
ncbi:MAG: ACT domain-containing protein [Ornithinibacter sp.]